MNTGFGKATGKGIARALLIAMGVAMSVAQRLPAATLLEGARVIYDARKAPIENGAILIDKGKIVKVGKAGEMQAPSGVERVDLKGKTVMPALIDTHIHIGYQKDASYAALNYTRENLMDQLQRYTYAGVAAVMSLGTDPGDILPQQRAYQERNGGTQILFAGRGIAAPNAGPGDGALKPSAYAVSTVEQARGAVRAEIARKVDFIKVWVDDRGGTVKKTSPEIYRAVIDEAHKRKARVIAHVFYLEDARELVKAGVDGFAHLVRDQEMDGALIAEMKQKGVVVMPNLGIASNRAGESNGWLDEPLYKETTPEPIIARVRGALANRTPQALAAAQTTYALMQKNLQKLNAAGVTLVLGGDSGAVPDHFHAFTSHREMQLMAEAGMTPAQVLASATVTGADFLRLRDKGTIEAGKSADLLVLDANPLENIANTRRIAHVYLGGQNVNREALKRGWR
ncbi:MAG: amidohydrolase family protein [Bryobacteraceae bacterium]